MCSVWGRRHACQISLPEPQSQAYYMDIVVHCSGPTDSVTAHDLAMVGNGVLLVVRML